MTLDSAVPMSLDGEQVDLLRLLAYVYLQHGKAGPAAVLFQAIHLLEPHDAAITRSLACSLLRDGQADEALALLDQLAFDGDFNALTELLRGQALARLGRGEEAAMAMHRFVALRTSVAITEGL
ncbi:MAG: hypothetical protein ACRYGK_12745 [Janthinobacterium lividum]